MTAATHRAVTDRVRAAFDACLGTADEAGAIALALDLLRAGVSAEEVLLGLIAPAQAAVGARWVTTEWTVAQEHAATHVSERTVAAVAAAGSAAPGPKGSPSARSVVLACVGGEAHTLPARIVTEVLRLRGFTVRFLGAHVPAARLVDHAHRYGPDLVALSCMMPVRLPRAHRLIEVSRLAGTPVLAGGPGFGPDGVWARTLGADWYAPDAAAAADLLTAHWPEPSQGVPALDHLADREYARLVGRRPELLRQVIDRLYERFPPMRSYAPDQHDDTVEDLGRILDFLAAAVYVDDPRVLTDFMAFSTEVLAARDIPPATLHLTLQALAGLLDDLPRTRAHVTAGRDWLEQAGHAYAAG